MLGMTITFWRSADSGSFWGADEAGRPAPATMVAGGVSNPMMNTDLSTAAPGNTQVP